MSSHKDRQDAIRNIPFNWISCAYKPSEYTTYLYDKFIFRLLSF